MTLLEIERLVRKVSELLQQVGNVEIAPKLAGDYAAACHATNLRLQQCEAMIKAGDRHQAIQLAETAPNLLDSVTALEFRGSDEWRAYCQQNSLSVADRIDARSVKILNECYAQGITTDHPLYSAYRRAVLNRNDEEALKTLQSITRLNPTDSNAASELVRLDAKVLAARMHHLATMLDAGDAASLVAEIEAIEAVGFKNKPEGEVWRKAQLVRCELLLQGVARLKSSSFWMEALSTVDFIHRLQSEFKLELSFEALAQLRTLEDWARGEQEKDRKEREFSSLLSELQFRITQSEDKDTSARYVKLPELRNDYEALHKVWHALTDFTRSIPEEAASKFQKRSGLLEGEIARRTAIQRRIILVSSVAVLLIGGIVTWLVLGQMKAREFSRQLHDVVAQRQVRTAAKLLEQARNEHIGDAGLLAEADTFEAKENSLQANFETAYSKLPKKLDGQPDAPRLSNIADQLALARNALNALAPDMKTESEPRLQAFETEWQRFLSESGAAVNGLFEQWVSSAENQSRELDYRAPLDKTSAQITALASLVQKISDCEVGFTNHLHLRSDLLQRSASVRAKFTAYDREFKKLDIGMTTIRRAGTIKEFSEGIGEIASSEFSTAPIATAASVVQSLNADDEKTLRRLLNATNASTWAYVTNAKFIRFVPEIAMPAEKQMFQELKNDPAVSASHQRYRLWLNDDGSKSVDWITAGPFDASIGWKKIKAWTPSASATSATFEDRDYGFFDGKYKLTPTEPVYRAEVLGNVDETASFNSVGLEPVWIGGDSYAKSMLEVLDSIKNSREGSPLFRAYLILRLSDLIALQPNAWGLAFCPSLRAHEAQLRTIVGGQLNSGDWFVPGKINACSAKLDQFFASVKDISYAKQAGGLLILERTVSKEGLQYVGFVGLDGKPNYVNGSSRGEVWGYSAIRNQPAFLADTNVKGSDALNEQAIPLSPLFALAKPCKEYLAIAGVNPKEASFQGALPALFDEPTRR